jgi:5S rRNA maturation endonuclease (ribonuclease M5)
VIKDIFEWKEKLITTNKLIIVEGKKDKNALNSLNIKNIFVLNNKPLYQVVEEVAELVDEAVILTDLDSEGKKLYSMLREYLERNGVKIDKQFREFLMKNTKITCIESIEKSFLEKSFSKN